MQCTQATIRINHLKVKVNPRYICRPFRTRIEHSVLPLERSDPEDEVAPSICSSVVLCSFVLSVYIVVLVLVFYLCPSSVRVVATFSGIVLLPLLCSVLQVFCLYFDSFLYLER
jgi:hypothetical protein